MCGIWFSLGFSPDRAHIDKVSHRGPDGSGWREFGSAAGPVALGHRRSSIIDLSESARDNCRFRAVEGDPVAAVGMIPLAKFNGGSRLTYTKTQNCPTPCIAIASRRGSGRQDSTEPNFSTVFRSCGAADPHDPLPRRIFGHLSALALMCRLQRITRIWQRS
jgi:hypothetical protein